MSDSEKGIEKKEGGSEHINLKVVGNVSKKLIIGREPDHLRTQTLRAPCLNLETVSEISAIAAPSCFQMPYETANCVQIMVLFAFAVKPISVVGTWMISCRRHVH
jgi:hypothetical protein